MLASPASPEVSICCLQGVQTVIRRDVKCNIDRRQSRLSISVGAKHVGSRVRILHYYAYNDTVDRTDADRRWQLSACRLKRVHYLRGSPAREGGVEYHMLSMLQGLTVLLA